MKIYLRGILYSFPVQLLFLHFRKHQILLLFWFLLFSTVDSNFLQIYGADSLFLAPEYLGNVNVFGAAIVGISIGMFIMSWNITGFILFSRHFNFLAATTNPFLKYCINNFCIPFVFLIFYFFNAWEFDRYKELIPVTEILILAVGFLCGLIFILAVSFIYFFQADKTILRQLMPVMNNPKEYSTYLNPTQSPSFESRIIKVEWYLDSLWSVYKVRDVSHYTRNFIENILKRHHFPAILSVFFAFLFLIIIGVFLDAQFFQLPAAASITVFFAILIGVFGAFSYFLQTWGLPFFVFVIIAFNFSYKQGWIDPRNKAYGLNYENKSERPEYSRDALLALTSAENINADSVNMIQILEKWKAKQTDTKPLMVVINTSGGGHRSASFTMSVLQRLDSITNGQWMSNTFLITGASGGMIGASYIRELYLRRLQNEKINLQSSKYVDDITADLLNPLFTAFVARDIISPALKFKIGHYQYVKDRAYSFETKLNESTSGFLDKSLLAYKKVEANAEIPLMFFNSVITRDGRQVLISTQPVRFMMSDYYDTSRISNIGPDVIDFISFFKKQDPFNLRVLSALRMNATFPMVLPNVWLPSNPIIDVMDAGIRDNFGSETTLRFLNFFDEWIKKNTRGVLLIQLLDRPVGAWADPYSTYNFTDHFTKPFLVLQHNWPNMQEYFQNNMLSYYSGNQEIPVHKIIFQYAAENTNNKVAISFHLTQREKIHIMKSPDSPFNQKGFKRVLELLNKKDTARIKPVE